MNADPLFTETIVRDFMVNNGGKVSNPVLVNHFQNFLNDPVRRNANRQKFKNYVNTLASVKLGTDGSKLLVLKKKYRDDDYYYNYRESEKTKGKEEEEDAEDDASTTSQTPGVVETPSKDLPVSETAKTVPTQVIAEELVQTAETTSIAPTSEEKEDESGLQGVEEVAKVEEDVMETTSTSDASILIAEQGNESSVTVVNEEKEEDVLVEEEVRSEPVSFEADAEVCYRTSSIDIIGPQSSIEPLPLVEHSEQSHITTLPNDTEDHIQAPHQVEMRNKPPTSTDTHASQVTPATDLSTLPSSNSLASQDYVKESAIVDSSASINSSLSSLHSNHSKYRNKKTTDTSGSSDHDSTGGNEWLLVACASDYQAMSKLLQSQPQLAHSRSVVTGYSALHWACKNGNGDVVKMLCGKYAVDPNARTQGGYTPLHLASMHQRHDVIELLLKVYKADAGLRDYSGRLAKAYSEHGTCTRTSEMLKPRRMGSILDYDQSIMRNQLQYLSPQKVAGKENSLPPHSPVSTKPFRPLDYSSLMPPPSQLPPIYRSKPPSRIRSASDMADAENFKQRQGSASSVCSSRDNDSGSIDIAHSDSEACKGMGALTLASQYFSSSPSVNNESMV